MLDQPPAPADKLTRVARVAREIGTKGRLGGRADVRDNSGAWKYLRRPAGPPSDAN
ncbi:hypothetical protein [Streptomyces sp. NBC_01280]|uniref:hypothetical protein n=1 Tax=Streptomyces sp. NBC_01280 TaxID=2903810 RepID=UPI002E35E407|nr:hypothetical protein [Streptomyces sp. NBC_01280]